MKFTGVGVFKRLRKLLLQPLHCPAFLSIVLIVRYPRLVGGILDRATSYHTIQALVN